MEGLRQALLAPACGTFLLLGGCIVAMKDMMECRYSLKDDNGKILLRHPYKPWEPVDQKHEEMAERAFRAFKMNENVKEWTFMSVPLVWSIAIFGGDLPYVTPNMIDTFIISSCLSYALVNHRYIKCILPPLYYLEDLASSRRTLPFMGYPTTVSYTHLTLPTTPYV